MVKSLHANSPSAPPPPFPFPPHPIPPCDPVRAGDSGHTAGLNCVIYEHPISSGSAVGVLGLNSREKYASTGNDYLHHQWSRSFVVLHYCYPGPKWLYMQLGVVCGIEYTCTVTITDAKRTKRPLCNLRTTRALVSLRISAYSCPLTESVDTVVYVDEQTAQMCKLIWTYVVCKMHKGQFRALASIIYIAEMKLCITLSFSMCQKYKHHV